MRPTWAEIDLGALAHNMREIRRITKPEARVMGVVKANAYGHGAVEVSRVLLASGADRLAVAIPEEGVQLREANINVPILVLGLFLPEAAPAFIEYDLLATVATLDAAAALSRAAKARGKTARVYIKLDTGMHRIGVSPAEAVNFTKKVAGLDAVKVEGMFSHFAVADARDKGYTELQFAAFQRVVDELAQEGIHLPYKSVANSATILDLPHMHLDFVRPGIITYGLYPSPEVARKIDARPAMQFKTRVVYLKAVPKGAKIGYGCTYTTPRDTVIATLPVGYADGYSRKLSNQGEVLIRGRRYPLAGRVCMDQIMVDVGKNADVAIGDEVVLFGRQGDGEISTDEIAAKVGTITYEIVCDISPRVPRVYINRP